MVVNPWVGQFPAELIIRLYVNSNIICQTHVYKKYKQWILLKIATEQNSAGLGVWGISVVDLGAGTRLGPGGFGLSPCSPIPPLLGPIHTTCSHGLGGNPPKFMYRPPIPKPGSAPGYQNQHDHWLPTKWFNSRVTTSDYPMISIQMQLSLLVLSCNWCADLLSNKELAKGIRVTLMRTHRPVMAKHAYMLQHWINWFLSECTSGSVERTCYIYRKYRNYRNA